MGKPERAFTSVKTKVYRFGLREITAMLIKHVDLHEGLWQLQVAFGQSATNLNVNGRLTPTAITQVMGLQLARVEEGGALTVDAAEVNPRSSIIVPETVN